jgi:hypothetical protein
VILDSFSVGRLDQDSSLVIEHVTIGHHDYRIVGATETETFAVDIRPNEIFHAIPRPNPPTNLTITVR